MKQEDLFKATAIPMPPVPDHGAVQGSAYPNPSQHATDISQSSIITLPEIIENADTTPFVKNMFFTDKKIRNGFIKKVYGIVLTQLALTGLIMFGFVQTSFATPFLMKNAQVILYTSTGVYFATFICMLCCEGPRRRVPFNYIFLLLFTTSTAVMLGFVAMRYNTAELLVAAGITFAIVLALTLFAFQTKIDFTMLTGSGVSILLALILLGTAILATNYNKMALVYTTLGVIVVSLFIVYDTQMIVGGHHRYGFSPEEYVFAAMILYVDIIILFMRILRLMR